MTYSYLQHPLESLFRAPSHVSVLRELFQLKAGISGRELARRCNMSDRNCRLVLNRLNTLGVVSVEGASTFRLYRLNRQHNFVGLFLKTLFQSESSFMKSLVTHITKSLSGNCLWAGIFGSVAQGYDIAESDLDILVLAKTSAQASNTLEVMHSLQTLLLKEWGVTLSPLVLTIKEWNNKQKMSPSVRQSIISDHTTLVGKDSSLS